MMSVEMMHRISWCCYVTAGVLSCVEIVLFFQFNIWGVIGDFTGTNKKREMKAICEKEQILQKGRHEIFEMREEHNLMTDEISYEEKTGLLEDKITYHKFVLVEELGFVESQEWL